MIISYFEFLIIK